MFLSLSSLKIFRKKRTKSQKVKDVTPAEQPSKLDIGSGRIQNAVETCTSPAFQEAWRKHWDDLSESEKGLWNHRPTQTPFQIEETMKRLDKSHLDKSFVRKMSDRTLSFLKIVDLLMRGATVAIQGAPSVGSVVLGVFRVVIDSAVTYLEYYDKLTEMMEYLTGILRTLGIYDGIKFNEPRLHDTLVLIYTNILAFCRHARRAYVNENNNQSPNALEVFAKVQWVRFEAQFGQIRDNLQHQIENLNIVSNAVTMKSVLAIEDNMNKKQSLTAQTERRDFLEWICTHDAEKLHDEISSKRYKDTGSWLVEKSSFKTWTDQKKKNILWLSGPPGTGKSILASVAINYLIERSKHTKDTVVYAYFKGEETNTQYLPTQIISSLVKQLCRGLPTLPEPAIEFYNNFQMNGRRPLFNDWQNLFLQCLKSFESVFIVLDGLDECEQKDRKAILNFVLDLKTQNEAVKIFVASRRLIDILHTFRRHNVLNVESTDSLAQEDIANLIKHRVATELTHIDPKVQETVIQTVTEKSKGMYLWVDLQLTDLAQVPEADIKTQLDRLPLGLEDTYVSIFRKINALPQTARTLSQLCFLWALYAKVVMDSGWFIDAVSLAHKTKTQKTRPYDADIIEEVTFGLLRIANFSFIRVRPIHFSLKEFLMDPNANHPDDLRRFFPDKETANAKLAIMCIQHLISDAEPQPLFDTCLLYCAGFFDSHIQDLTTIPEELWEVLDDIFLERPEMLKRIGRWKWPSHEEEFPNQSCIGNPKIIDPEVFMRCTKLHHIPAIWSRYKVADRSIQDYPEDNIFLASLGGLDDILEKIVSKGTNIVRATNDRLTLLHVALWGMSSDEEKASCAMKILLDAGADWNFDARHIPSGTPLEDYKTPLNTALSQKLHRGVQVIVTHKSFNLATYMKTIPAKCAHYIRILVDQGADINMRDEYGDTALRIARDDGRQDCVEILGELGAVE